MLIYNNVIYYIKKNDFETDNMFWERAWFVVKNCKDGIIDNEVLSYSKLWQCYKFYECIYDESIISKIKEMEANICVN